MMLLSKILRIGGRALMASALLAVAVDGKADLPLDYHVSVAAQGSSESLAPYMLGSWNEGRYVEGSGIWQEAGISKALDADRRFSWSAGVDYILGYGSKTDYDRYNPESGTFSPHAAKMPVIRLTQLYAKVKYRSVFLTAGMKNEGSFLLDDALSSGDLTRSNNAAAIPGVAIGFLDFVDIPFTKGWVQINGEIMYGRMLDSGFKENEFNYFSGVRTMNLWYNYKRCYFRTNPEKPFHVTVGMQAAGMFGGSSFYYQKGKRIDAIVRGFRVKDALQMLFPREGGEDYYTGSHLGSWDLKATYRLKDGSDVSAYFEWPWEDGSGIGRANGWDGLWGVQYNFARKGIVSKAVVEYLDFTNQSGPIHYAPHDHPNNCLTGHASGADDYYNNDDYGAYTNYGMGIGTPFLKAPIYNRTGALGYLNNRARGFHAAVEGNPSDRWSYRAMVGYQVAGGNGWVPVPRRLHCTSAMLEAKVSPLRNLPGFEIDARMAFDAGSLRGDNFGARVRLSYTGDFSIKGKKSSQHK